MRGKELQAEAKNNLAFKELKKKKKKSMVRAQKKGKVCKKLSWSRKGPIMWGREPIVRNMS
jgi:hypothetical protein